MICEHLPSEDQLAGLARTNRRFYEITKEHLYTKERTIVATRYAARHDKVDCIQSAIRENIRLYPGSRGKPFRGSLVAACKSGSINVARLIVYQFPEMLVEDTDDETGIHALSAAASTGQLDVVSWLLTFPPVDPNQRDKAMRTPLIWACVSGTTTVVEKLLARNDIRLNDSGLDRMTPLEVSYDTEMFQVMPVLMRDRRIDLAACRINIMTDAVRRSRYNVVRFFLNFYHSHPVIHNDWAYKALRAAIVNNETEIISFYITLPNFDINATPSGDGLLFPPLLWVAIRRPGDFWQYVLPFPNLDLNVRYSRVNGTPLIAAVRANRDSLATMLIYRGCLLNERDDSIGFTALMLAVTNKNEDMVRLLLSKEDIDLSVKDRNGMSVLFHATAGREYHIMKILLDHPQADVNICDDAGMTPLMLAVSKGRYNMAHLLVEKGGIDYNIEDNQGKTVWSHIGRGRARRRFTVLIRAGMRNEILPRRPVHTAAVIARMHIRLGE